MKNVITCLKSLISYELYTVRGHSKSTYAQIWPVSTPPPVFPSVPPSPPCTHIDTYETYQALTFYNDVDYK